MDCLLLMVEFFGALFLLFFLCWLIGSKLPFDEYVKEKYKGNIFK